MTKNVTARSKTSKSMFLENDVKAEWYPLLLCLNADIDPTRMKLLNTTIVLTSWFIAREINVMNPVKAKLSMNDKTKFSSLEKWRASPNMFKMAKPERKDVQSKDNVNCTSPPSIRNIASIKRTEEKAISNNSNVKLMSIFPFQFCFSVVLISQSLMSKYRTIIVRTSNRKNGYFIQDSISHKVKDEKKTANTTTMIEPLVKDCVSILLIDFHSKP
jgi:hypothetical protein